MWVMSRVALRELTYGSRALEHASLMLLYCWFEAIISTTAHWLASSVLLLEGPCSFDPFDVDPVLRRHGTTIFFITALARLNGILISHACFRWYVSGPRFKMSQAGSGE
jgi:hypothetical protein